MTKENNRREVVSRATRSRKNDSNKDNARTKRKASTQILEKFTSTGKSAKNVKNGRGKVQTPVRQRLDEGVEDDDEDSEMGCEDELSQGQQTQKVYRDGNEERNEEDNDDEAFGDDSSDDDDDDDDDAGGEDNDLPGNRAANKGRTNTLGT